MFGSMIHGVIANMGEGLNRFDKTLYCDFS